jgi:hypothetical protein
MITCRKSEKILSPINGKKILQNSFQIKQGNKHINCLILLKEMRILMLIIKYFKDNSFIPFQSYITDLIKISVVNPL